MACIMLTAQVLKSLKGTGTAGMQEVQGVITLEAEVEVTLGAPSPVITQCRGVHL